MATVSGRRLLPHIRELARSGDIGGATDGQLLEWFLARREEAAFRALVDRHGPMVMGVCRRVLGDAHDAEDVFQATFLVLVCKAASIVPREFLANWLYGVACRTAHKARVARARADAAVRRAYDRRAAMAGQARTEDEVWHDLRPVLDQELQRLPDAYRVAVVLCDLEGMPRKDAARQLGWPEGTLSGRLARARRLLAERLTRRGVTLSAAPLAAALAQGAAPAAVPAALKASLTRAAALIAGGGRVPAGVVSARVSALTEGVMKTMLLARLRVGVLVLAAAVMAATGTGLVARQVAAPGGQQPSRADGASLNPAERAGPADEKAQLAGAEMHVIGVYGAKEGDGGIIDVEVRPTPKPVVLVLTAYYSVDWRVKLADHARIKQVVISGYNAQEVNGVPADVPVVNRSYFPDDGSRRKEGWFWADQWNTPQWREMARRLNDLTGLPAATFQSANQGASFIVDGNRGREFGQKELKPRAPAPKEPTPQEVRAAAAGAELHVVSVSDPCVTNPTVEVRATAKPVVLALTSSLQAAWNVKPADGARIKAVLVGSSMPQEVDGLPAGVPVLHCCPDPSYFFDRRGGRRGGKSFHAYQPNTLEYRRMVEQLNDLTGLLLSTFQVDRGDTPFVVDGARGREFAQKERKPRWTPPKEPTPQELLAACAGAELQVVGLYQPRDGNGVPVDVEVRRTDKPVVLVLTSYFSVLWNVKIADGARVKAVILGGWFEQELEGVPAGVLIVYRASNPSGRQDYFWGYKADTFEYRRMVDRLNDLTGLLVATYQGEYQGSSFVIDGTRGREFAQKERKPRWTPPKEPTPQELLAAAAGAELQVVGIYQPGGGTTVDVEVRPTDKPIVLALASYMEVRWNVKIAAGARVKAVIVGGWFEQELDGLPKNIPVVYRAANPSRRENYFYAYKPDTIDYRRMVDRLNDLTGLLVSTAQLEYRGSSFVVDGARGREFAQKERKPRWTPPKEPTPQELLAACAGAELQVVGLYQPRDGHGALVEVEVKPTAKPVVLALTSYMEVIWKVRIAEGARLRAVVVGGWFEQEVEGVPAGVPIVYRASNPSGRKDYIYAYKQNSPEYRRMAAKLSELTSLPVATFQAENTGASFVIDGERGRIPASNEPKAGGPKAPAPKPPKAQEDPLADVADIPSQDLRAASDADKRYFLIGPKKDARPPTQGYGLAVILPGGDGSADFNPFVRRVFKNALPDGYVAAQPVAVKWTPDQRIVWPTKTNPVAGMKFGTEEFVEAVIEDVAKKHKLDRTRVFTLAWSSSGPAAYATSLQDKRGVTGSLIAMSVFDPKFLPPLKAANGHAYYLYHSPEDRVCPYRMAEQAKSRLAENGAKVRLATYDGGHGWRGDVYTDIRGGVEWLERNGAKAGGP